MYDNLPPPPPLVWVRVWFALRQQSVSESSQSLFFLFHIGEIMAISLALAWIVLSSLACRHERACYQQKTPRACLSSGQYLHSGFVACAWNSSIYGTEECRADFHGLFRTKACDKKKI